MATGLRRRKGGLSYPLRPASPTGPAKPPAGSRPSLEASEASSVTASPTATAAAKGSDALTARLARWVDTLGSCSNLRLFFLILLSRLPVVAVIAVFWDMVTADYDTSTLLMPTVMPRGFEAYPVGTGNAYAFSDSTPAPPSSFSDEKRSTAASGGGVSGETASALLEDALGPMTPEGTAYEGSHYLVAEPFRAFRCFRHWDVLHFTHIAHHGYSHEHLHAFFPGVPLLLRAWGVAARAVGEAVLEPFFDATMSVGDSWGSTSSSSSSSPSVAQTAEMTRHLSKRPILITLRNLLRYALEDVGAVCLSLGAFAAAGVVLRSLTVLLLNERGSDVAAVLEGDSDSFPFEVASGAGVKGKKSGGVSDSRARLLGVVIDAFLTMPAGVFTLAPYTESLFALLVFIGIYLFKKGTNAFDAKAIREASVNKRGRSQQKAANGGGFGICWRGIGLFVGASLLFSSATLVRSNGILMSGYFLHELFFHRLRLLDTLRHASAASSTLSSSSPLSPSSCTASSGLSAVGVSAHKDTKKSRRIGDTCSVASCGIGEVRADSPVLVGGVPFWGRALLTLICTAITVAPYVAVNYIAWRDFCGDGASDSSAASLHDAPLMPSLPQTQGSGEGCPPHWWQFYGYIQAKYWGVRPFSAYSLKNAPNFCIPAPMVAFIAIGVALYWRRPASTAIGAPSSVAFDGACVAGANPSSPLSGGRRQSVPALLRSPLHKLLVCFPLRAVPPRLLGLLVNPHVACLALMMVFASIMMHVQVMVRFVLASPAYYWVAAALLTRGGGKGPETKAEKEGDERKVEEGAFAPSSSMPSMGLLYLLWSVAWFFGGCIFFPNHYPWT